MLFFWRGGEGGGRREGGVDRGWKGGKVGKISKDSRDR